MVTVKNYHVRTNPADNSTFITLELMGDIELLQSQKTGRFYATTRKCFVSSTFDERTAQMMVGKQIKGNITKVECEPYDFTVEETGEVIQLSHKYDYLPEENLVRSPERVPA